MHHAAMRGLVLALALLASPALAQPRDDAASGRAVARSFAPLPAPVALEVVAGDNSTENLAIRRRLVEALAGRGAAVRDAAPLVFRFDTEIRERGPDARSPGLSREGATLEPDAPRRGDDPPDEVMNLFSSRDRALIAPPPRSPSYARALNYVINATIEERGSGRRLWQGHVRYATAEPDAARIFAGLVPHLVAELDRTTPGRAFTLE